MNRMKQGVIISQKSYQGPLIKSTKKYISYTLLLLIARKRERERKHHFPFILYKIYQLIDCYFGRGSICHTQNAPHHATK